MAQNHDLLKIATAAAEAAAGHITRVARPDPASWDRKARSDFVTAVDRDAERLIAEQLTAGVPESVVMGEELSPDAPDAPIRWVVDPLDGTANYLHDYPAYAVSIAAVMDGAPVAGVVLDVARQRTYTATAGGGAWCDGRRLSVSAVEDPAQALIGTGFPFKSPALEGLDDYLDQFRKVLPLTAGIRRGGSAATDLAFVAEGRFDAFWEAWLAPWDVAAGILLVREAGGVVTNANGDPHDLSAGPIVAGNPAMYRWLFETVTR